MNTIKFNSLIIAFAILAICETGGGMILKNIFTLSTIGTIFMLRIFETGFLIVIAITSELGFWDRGVFQHLETGIRTGLIWSFCFAVAALTGGILILFTTQTNPLLVFKSPLISSLNTGKAFERTLFMFTGCIVSPFAEELFFRGFVYSFFRKYGFAAALFISTFAFGLCHISGSNAIDTTLFIPLTGGFIFALSYEYSKSLAAPVIIHILGNTAIFALSLLR